MRPHLLHPSLKRGGYSERVTVDKQRVALVIRPSLISYGLKHILDHSPWFQVVSQTNPSLVTIAQAVHYQPDLILLEITQAQDLDAAVHLSCQYPLIKLVLWGQSLQEEGIQRSYTAGIKATVQFDVEPDHLLTLLRRVCNGECLLPDPDKAVSKLRSVNVPAANFSKGPLSQRELQVLDCIAEGFSNKKIALKLDVSAQTVKNHVTSILRKMEVEDRTQAVMQALRQGLISLNSRT